MAQLFVQDDSRLWTVLELTAEAYHLSPPVHPSGPPRGRPPGLSNPSRTNNVVDARESRSPTVASARVDRLARDGALLLKRSEGDETTVVAGWSLLTGVDTRLRINGVSIALGIATLRHRDEIRLDGGAPLYFSTERLVNVEPYGGEDAPRCPRCTLSVERGEPCVRCPACDVVHHQLSDRECWTYSETCALCDQASDLTAGYRWSPEDL